MNRRMNRSDAMVLDSMMILAVIFAILMCLTLAQTGADKYAESEYRGIARENASSPRAGDQKNDAATAGTAYPAVVPCDTDSDCHAKNPGLCREEEPYCFPR